MLRAKMRAKSFHVSLLICAVMGVGVANATPKNPVLDLTIPAPVQPITDPALFDETVLMAPNFAISQEDPALSELFSPTGASNLCVPTAIAQDLIFLSTYAKPSMNQLILSGMAPDRKSIDPNALIRQLASLCKTDAINGTTGYSAIDCVSTILKQSGYGLGNTTEIFPGFVPDSTRPVQARMVTLKDIRDTLKSGVPALLDVGWYKYDSTTQSWTYTGGHLIGVYGYDYSNAWGENMIQIKMINPDLDYGTGRGIHYDTVTIERYSPQPGVKYPANRPFIFSGTSFGGTVTRGFLNGLTRIAPSL